MSVANRRVRAFVAGVGVLATGTVALLWLSRGPFPGVWALFVFVVVGILLEVTSSQQKATGATGSISFLVDLSAPLLFGGFWACLITALRVTISKALVGSAPIRIAFNVAQMVLAVGAAALVYSNLVPAVPPRLLVETSSLPFNRVLVELAAYFGAAAVYFAVNAFAVSSVVALSAGRALRQVVGPKTFGFLGYDLLASVLALVVAWVYVTFDSERGLARLAILAVFVPLVFARHMYAKLNTLQILYDELDRAHERLELSLREQLEMMVKSIEARDPYTSGHSRRVAALSKAIAMDLGFDGEHLEEVENAALLHDVGKIHAEFAPLLQKEGRLTQEEWEVMKTHAAKSAELVSLFTRFRGSVEAAVRWHHERWDGKGYPDGIPGEAIPIGARIIMISDTIDAMTTDRPYRKALPFDKVISELLKYRGSQFDPRLVDVTINSVTVRRLVSDKEFLAEQTRSDRPIAKAKSRPALRSQSNFLDAIRSASSSLTS
jgi:HD-GYP domain-containing protein (c-di-GMP phosphodiesterase class II)